MGIAELINEYGSAGVMFGFVVTWVYFHFQIKNTNTRIDDIKDGIKEIKEGQRQFISYMKEHGERISELKGRVDEVQRPTT